MPLISLGCGAVVPSPPPLSARLSCALSLSLCVLYAQRGLSQRRAAHHPRPEGLPRRVRARVSWRERRERRKRGALGGSQHRHRLYQPLPAGILAAARHSHSRPSCPPAPVGGQPRDTSARSLTDLGPACSFCSARSCRISAPWSRTIDQWWPRYARGTRLCVCISACSRGRLLGAVLGQDQQHHSRA